MIATTVGAEQSAGVPAATRRRLRLDRSALVALLLGAGGVGYRIWLTCQHAPLTNSDEATMGLAALHINNGARPVFFYGQYYMGTLEAYAAAPLFRLFGPSVLVQRVPVLLCFALFAWLAYRLTRLVYRPWLATLVVGLLALGADRVVKDQLIAAGGYPEMLPLATGALLLAVLLGRGEVRPRLLGFAGFGLLAGLILWDDWLILPYLLAAAVLLVVGCARELWRWPGLALLGGAVLGALPLIIYNVQHPEHNSFSAYLGISSGGAPVPLADRVHGAVGTGIALANGGCQPSRCGPAQQAGGYLFLVLFLVSAGLAGWALWHQRAVRRGTVRLGTVRLGTALQRTDESGTGGRRGTPGIVADRIRLVAQVCLAGAALLTIALYVRSPSAGATPVESARYLAGTQISLGAALWPLWLLARRLVKRPRAASGEEATRPPGSQPPGNQPPESQPAGSQPAGSRRVGVPARLAGAVAVVLLAVLSVDMVAATVGAVRVVPATRADHRRTVALAAELERLGVRHFYSEYWTCNKLTFATRERVVCAVILDDNLQVGYNRYITYLAKASADPAPAYVAAVGGLLDAELRHYFVVQSVTPTVTELAGYRIYQVVGRIGIPVR